MKIVICGNYGAENLGDELILEGLLETLKNIAPGAEITVMSGNPEATEKSYNQKYGIKAVEKFPSGFRSILKSIFSNSATKDAVKNCDYFILGGGGLFNDLNWHASIIWAMQARQALKLNKPLIMYGQSIGPLSDLGRYLVKKIFAQAAFIGVRDQDSATELKNLGITKEICVTPDLAFRVPAEIGPITETATLPTAIISLRQLGTTTGDFIKEFSSFCNWLIEEKNYSLQFIDFQQGTESDKNLHQSIITQIRQSEKISHLDQTLTSQRLLEHFKNADFVFAMRMHAIICAMKTCKPFLAISYSRKINSLIKDSALEKYLIAHDHVYFEQLKNFFTLLNDKREEVREKLSKLNSANLEKLQSVEIKLKDLLK